jgi:hypothetical protein
MRHIYPVLIALVLVTLLAACTQKPATPASTSNPTPAKQTDQTPPQTAQTDGGTTTVAPGGSTSPQPGMTPGTAPTSGASGGMTLTGTLPPEWPSDVPMMSGFSVGTSVVQHPTGALVIVVTAKGKAPATDVQKFYLELKGWQPDHRIPWTNDPAKLFFKLTKGSEDLGITVTTAKDGTTEISFQYMKSGAPAPPTPPATPSPR